MLAVAVAYLRSHAHAATENIAENESCHGATLEIALNARALKGGEPTVRI